jgi:hypothetical protein
VCAGKGIATRGKGVAEVAGVVEGAAFRIEERSGRAEDEGRAGGVDARDDTEIGREGIGEVLSAEGACASLDADACDGPKVGAYVCCKMI